MVYLFLSAISEDNCSIHGEDVTQIHLSILKSHSITKYQKVYESPFSQQKEGTDLAPWQRIQMVICLNNALHSMHNLMLLCKSDKVLKTLASC